MKQQALFLSVIISFGAIIPRTALLAPRASGDVGASATVRDFYRYHFSHDRSYETANLRGRRRWLSAELYSLLMYEQRRKVPPDEPPYIDGDPFTDSQDLPDSFRIGRSVRFGGGARVTVFVYWHENGAVIERRKYAFIMVRQRGGWEIADIINHDGESLLKELRELKRKDGY